MILYTRIINLVLSVCMILTSLLSLLTTADATTGVLACYVVVFSCLLCCFETHLKQISKIIASNFGFMYSAKSRCLFMIFVGTILFSFSLFGKIIGLAMLANAGFNFYAIITYPGYEDAQRKDAQAEIQDFLSANPAYAKTALSMGMTAGADFVSKNPGLSFFIIFFTVDKYYIMKYSLVRLHVLILFLQILQSKVLNFFLVLRVIVQMVQRKYNCKLYQSTTNQ
jgi:COPI associated protein